MSSRNIILIALLELIINLHVSAQKWEIVRQVGVSNMDLLFIDTQGNILTTGRKGELSKYDQSGNFILTYSPVQRSPITAVEIFSKFKILLFYQDLQEYVLLNRYLGAPITYPLNSLNIGYVEDIALNFQQNIWLIDMTDFALKLMDATSRIIIETKSLSQVLDQNEIDIISFQSYQNRLYLTDRQQGVLVFDNMGNFLFRWAAINTNIQFYKDELYYQQDKKLVLIHLYNKEEKELILPDKHYDQIGFFNDRLIAVSQEGFDIYQYLSDTK